ncbi:MAG: 3'-5' exoribonuclease YhaM family protein [Planctomycetia bacterium]
MERCFVREYADGDAVDDVLLVQDKQVRSNRAGNTYLLLELGDKTGSVAGFHWNSTDAETRAFDAGDFLSIRGKVQLYQGQIQLIVNSFRKCPADGVDLADFIPSSEKDAAVLLAELKEQLRKVKNPHLQALAQAFLMDDDLVKKLQQAPAGVRNHHAYIGGLLEHIVNLLKVHDRIADLYPQLNHDLLRMGLFLHDIGKLRELGYDRGFAYSDEGQLVGHVVIGVEMLNEKLPVAAKLLGEPTPPELAVELKHLILSHHGSYEFGSPRLPMTPEAAALHHLDNLDAKVANYTRTIAEDLNSANAWTPFDHKTGRRLYKGSLRKPAAPAARKEDGGRSLSGKDERG